MLTNVYIVAHKPYTFPEVGGYKTIQVGCSQETFGDIRDNMGESIFEKNRNYCELTALYWIWKNDLISDIVGLCHYRRYFDLSNEKVGEYIIGEHDKEYLENVIDIKNIEKYLVNVDVILPCPVFLGINRNIESQYKVFHRQEDFKILKEVILRLYPEYENAINKVMQKKWMYSFNMFIMKREIFERYMNWLFTILFEAEKNINIEDNTYQERIFGFLSERLLNIYIYYHRLRIKEVSYIFIKENTKKRRYISKKRMIMGNIKDIVLGN